MIKTKYVYMTLSMVIFAIVCSYFTFIHHGPGQITKLKNKLNNTVQELERIKNNNKLTVEQNSIVKLILKLQPRLDPQLAKLFCKSIITYSKKYGFPPELITCLINRESSFNPVAVSSANCVGLMQINPKAHEKLLKSKGITYYQASYIDNNIEMGCIILKEYYRKHNNNIKKALTNYVGGTHTKYINDILENFTSSQIDVIDSEKKKKSFDSKITYRNNKQNEVK